MLKSHFLPIFTSSYAIYIYTIYVPWNISFTVFFCFTGIYIYRESWFFYDFSMICRCSSEIRVINFLITCWLGNYGKLIKRSHVLCFFDVLGHVLWLFDDFWPFSVSLLVLNVGNGWESGNGMVIFSDYGSCPKIPCVKRTSKL